jgi:aryl-alcohol dehydrogenase-like predicted oxidoreductase
MASVIIGATSMEQLRECIDAFDVDLDEDTLKAIDEIHMEHRNPMFTD